MVFVAGEGAFVDAGSAGVAVFDDVVGLGPGGGAVAVGEAAAEVSGRHDESL